MLVGVKLDKQILITKKEDPQIAAKIIRSIKLFDTNLLIIETISKIFC